MPGVKKKALSLVILTLYKIGKRDEMHKKKEGPKGRLVMCEHNYISRPDFVGEEKRNVGTSHHAHRIIK